MAQSYLDLAVRIDPEETLVGDEDTFGEGGGDACVVFLVVVVM